MAVLLKKPISRETLAKEQYGKYRGKALIVTLLPGDEIEFRAKGTKTRYSVYLGHVYRLAQIMFNETEYKKEMEKYKSGHRKRKPKKPALPYSKIYFKAL